MAESLVTAPLPLPTKRLTRDARTKSLLCCITGTPSDLSQATIEDVPRWNPMHPEFVIALRALDATGLPYAELWRRLIPVATRIGEPRPSYWRVRRFLIAERRRKALRAEILDAIAGELLTGKAPWSISRLI